MMVQTNKTADFLDFLITTISISCNIIAWHKRRKWTGNGDSGEECLFADRTSLINVSRYIEATNSVFVFIRSRWKRVNDFIGERLNYPLQ